MEKLTGLHMDELILVTEKEIRGRKMAERLGNVQRGYTEELIGKDTKTMGRTMEEEGGGGKERGEKTAKRKERKRDKSEQVLIGERPGGECQRYLLSQRGLRCEARLSRGP